MFNVPPNPIYIFVLVQVVSDNTSKIIQGVPVGKVYILGGHSISNSKQKYLYEHVSHSEQF